MRETPNLDAMSENELHDFMRQLEGGKVVPSEENKILWQYACEKSAAMRLRRIGRINAAVFREGLCDSLYESLPADKRWLVILVWFRIRKSKFEINVKFLTKIEISTENRKCLSFPRSIRKIAF